MNSSLVVLLGMLLVASPAPSHAQTGSVEQGQKLWMQEVTNKQGEVRACTSCHGTDLTQMGEHRKTKKPIKPMAKSVNPERYEDNKEVEKWFKRNCKWTWGRECTAQEKTDILAYLKSL